jgi:hypothetical protein
MPMSAVPAMLSQASVKRQPRRRVLLAVVHVAVDGLAVDVLHVVGEELGDVLVGAPVQRHAQVIAELGLELVLQVLAREQVGAEPVQVGELLVGQLVELLVGAGGEAGADEVLQVQPGVGPLLALAGHVVGQVHDLAVAVVRTDQVGVADPAVVDALARLHRGLQLLDHVAFLDQVVLDLDAGDLGQRPWPGSCSRTRAW